MRELDRKFEDPNAALLRALQLRLAEAQLKREEAGIAQQWKRDEAGIVQQTNRASATVEGIRQQGRYGKNAAEETAIFTRARQLNGQGMDAETAVARAAQEVQEKQGEKHQAMLAEIAGLEKSGNPSFIRQAQQLRAQLAADGYTGYSPGAMVTFDQAERAALSRIGSTIKTNLDAIVAPYAGQEASYQDERSGAFGGAFTRNRSKQLSPEELANMKQGLDDLAEEIAAQTGVIVEKVRAAIYKKADAMIKGTAANGTTIESNRAAEIMAALRGY